MPTMYLLKRAQTDIPAHSCSLGHSLALSLGSILSTPVALVTTDASRNGPAPCTGLPASGGSSCSPFLALQPVHSF